MPQLGINSTIILTV